VSMDAISARRKRSSSSPARRHVSTHRRRSELSGLAGCGIRFHDNKGMYTSVPFAHLATPSPPLRHQSGAFPAVSP